MRLNLRYGHDCGGKGLGVCMDVPEVWVSVKVCMGWVVIETACEVRFLFWGGEGAEVMG